MALVVENGSGLPDAESYVSVAEFDAHCGAWLYDLTGKTTAQKEAALRQASAFLDTIGRYKGGRLLATQALEFPRAGLVDWSGFEVAGVPARVKRACSDLAFKALSGPLLQDLDRGGKVVSESVGPISTTYADDAPAGKTFSLAEKLVEPYLRGSNPDMNGPAWSVPGEEDPAESGIFAVGMHDADGVL